MTIRRVPSDFLVEECPTEAARAAWQRGEAGAGHAVYELTKASLTTPEACAGLARALGARGGSVDYAGLKDKHARTVQFVSVPWAGKPSAGPAAEVSGPGWSARLAGWSSRALSAESIGCNRFTIVVRDLTRPASDEMERRARLLAEEGEAGPRVGIINYFGDQRFGSARAGRGFMGRRLIEGDFEGALRLAIATPARKDAARVKAARKTIAARWGDWSGVLAELGQGPARRAVEVLAGGGGFREAFAALPHFDQVMAVEAYQSFLWNATARRLAEGMAGASAVRAEDEYGEMVFAPAAKIGPAWREVEVPMLASTTRLEGVWAGAAAESLAAEGIGVETLRIPGLRRPAFGEAMRALVVWAEAFSLEAAEADELSGGGRRGKRTVRFALPRGAYATVVLRALGQ